MAASSAEAMQWFYTETVHNTFLVKIMYNVTNCPPVHLQYFLAINPFLFLIHDEQHKSVITKSGSGSLLGLYIDEQWANF